MDRFGTLSVIEDQRRVKRLQFSLSKLYTGLQGVHESGNVVLEYLKDRSSSAWIMFCKML